MNNHNETLSIQSPWLAHIHKQLAGTNKAFHASDSHHNAITLEWLAIDPSSTQLSETIKQVSPILIDTYIKQELEFARKKPEEIPTDWMLKPLAPLFEHGVESVDWASAEQQLRATMNALFSMTDWSQSSGAHDIHIFVFAKDQQDTLIGIIQFLVTPAFELGTMKAALYGVAQSALDSGIEQLLMCSIFALIPETKRIFLHTRTTNEAAITMYTSWGFVPFAGPLPTWIDLEYVVSNTDALRNRAKTLQY